MQRRLTKEVNPTNVTAMILLVHPKVWVDVVITLVEVELLVLVGSKDVLDLSEGIVRMQILHPLARSFRNVEVITRNRLRAV